MSPYSCSNNSPAFSPRTKNKLWKFNIAPEKWWFGRLLSFWNVFFQGRTVKPRKNKHMKIIEHIFHPFFIFTSVRAGWNVKRPSIAARHSVCVCWHKTRWGPELRVKLWKSVRSVVTGCNRCNQVKSWLTYCWWFRHPVFTSWCWWLIPLFTRFQHHPRWCRISSINSTTKNVGDWFFLVRKKQPNGPKIFVAPKKMRKNQLIGFFSL